MYAAKKNRLKIAIVGLPNTGKSHVFSNLTGEYALTANFPFTTVEQKAAYCRIGDMDCEVIDTPGMHCLYIHSEEELIVRDMLYSDVPDVIVQCIDANRLKQSLSLTADLLELEVPLVISLNAVDEIKGKGIWIDSGALSNGLGVAVIESMAVKGIGNDDLKDAILHASRGKKGVTYGEAIEKGISSIVSNMPGEIPYKRKTAILLLLEDPFLWDYLKGKCRSARLMDMKRQVDALKRIFNVRMSRSINNKKNNWVDGLIAKSRKEHKVYLKEFLQTFAVLSRHPVFGVPILLGMVMTMFFLVVNVANNIAAWMNALLWVPVNDKINALVTNVFWNEFLVGDYGVLSLGVANAVLTILPILSVFYIMFNAMEDIGYIPNLCVLTKRVFAKVGLSGNSIMPLALGFGCKTMATMMTRSLRSEKEKYIAIFLIAFAIPCAAQMGLNMSILGRMGVRAFFIAFSALAFVEIAAGLILNKMLKDDVESDFIQELPFIRLPNPRVVLKKTYYRLRGFIREAMPVFVYAALIMFFADKIGVLNALKHLLKPVMEGFLGLPVQMVDALILCMARQEAAAGMIMRLIDKGELTYIQCITSVVITTMFVPCFANIVAMVKELGAKSAISMVVIINVNSFILAGALNWILVALL